MIMVNRKTLVMDEKWMVRIDAAVQGKLEPLSQTVTARIRELAERYAEPLLEIVDEVASLSIRVDEHLKQMGATWK